MCDANIGNPNRVKYLPIRETESLRQLAVFFLLIPRISSVSNNLTSHVLIGSRLSIVFVLSAILENYPSKLPLRELANEGLVLIVTCNE